MLSANRTTQGILAMIGFAAIAPGMDAFAKATPAEIPVGQVLGFRFGVQALVLVPLAMWLGIWNRPGTRDLLIHLARAVALLAATGFFFAALRHMGMASAIAIFFVEPFIVALMGAMFLAEPIGPRRTVACAVGFAGALLVIRPSFADLGWPALYPLGTAVLFAAYMVLTRQISSRAHPVAIQAWTALAAAGIVMPLLAMGAFAGVELLDPVWPSRFGWITLLGVGLISTVSHLILSVALRLAPASVIAPFQYFEIVAASALGFFIFGDFPDWLTWTGIAIIVASGLYLFARERAVAEG